MQSPAEGNHDAVGFSTPGARRTKTRRNSWSDTDQVDRSLSDIAPKPATYVLEIVYREIRVRRSTRARDRSSPSPPWRRLVWRRRSWEPISAAPHDRSAGCGLGSEPSRKGH